MGLDYLPQLVIVALFLLWPAASLWLQRVGSLAHPKSIHCRPAALQAPPFGYGDLFDELDTELAKAGFRCFAWFEVDFGPGYGPAQPFCLYRHEFEATELAVHLPDANRPSQLRFIAATELAGGTVLQTYAYDARSAAMSTGRWRRRSVAAETPSDLLESHRAWREEFAEPDAPGKVDAAEVAAEMQSSYSEMLNTLVAEGHLRPARNGKLRPPRRLIRRLLRAEDEAPKRPADPMPPPLARQRAMLTGAETEEAVPGGRGWRRFVLSALAFAGLGGAVWGWQIAASLLAVVAFHELGHFLAMRRFGYRHVRMVLVPLLGGVATGVESDPSGTRRAIVSLAGPVPGIILGWGLIAVYLGSSRDSYYPGTPALLTTAFALLSLNYLNLLPIPPLDGGRLLESLIPRSWTRVEAGVMGLAAAAGLILAWRLEFILLAVLVVWQLFAQRQHMADRRLAVRLSQELGPDGIRCPNLDLHLLKALADERPKDHASLRIARARRLLGQIKLRPAVPRARLAIAAVYLATFLLPFVVVPQAAALLSAQLGFGGVPGSDDIDEGARYAEEAGDSPVNQLLMAVAVHNSYRAVLQCGVPPGESDAAPEVPDAPAEGWAEADLDAAEVRLGVTLPDEYRRMMRLPAAPAANLRPPAELVRAGSAVAGLALDPGSETVEVVSAGDGEGRVTEISLERLRRAVLVSARLRETVLLDVSEGRAECCLILVRDLEGGLIGYPSIRSWLEGIYPAARVNAGVAREMIGRNRDAMEETAGLPLPDLLKLVERRVRDYPRQLWEELDRTPVDEAGLQALRRRLGSELPGDYITFLKASNGLPQLELLPAAALRRSAESDWPAPSRERRTRLVGADGRVAGDYAYPGDARQRSIVIASLPPARGVTFDPSAVLVPDGDTWRYVNLQTNCAYQSFDQYLRAEYARQRTYDTGPSRPALDP